MDREAATDVEMFTRLLQPAGRDVVDVGCGGGALVRELAARGARVIGVEISGEQLAAAIARDGAPGAPGALAASAPGRAAYRVGRAQELPLDDASVDIVVFMRALHHVETADLLDALRESRRVLRGGGHVYVAEPLAEGDFFALTSLVEDELEVRRAAQAALGEAALAGLRRVTTVEYDVDLRVTGVQALRSRIVSVDPQRAAIFDARRDEIAAAFARLGAAGERPGERRFVAPTRVDLLIAD